MRILLFGNQGYASVILADLVSSDTHEVVALCSRPPLRFRQRLRIKIGAILRMLRLRADDGHVLKGPFDDFDDPARLARANGIEGLTSRGLRGEATLARVGQLAPDMILVAGFHRLIPPTIYGLAQQAAINFHPGPLPEHRGGTPNRWIVRNGESESCITAHVLSEEFDTGDIVAEQPIPVRPQDTWGDVELRIAEAMPALVRQVIDAVAEGRLERRKQDAAAASYEPSYGDRHRVIDWRLAAEDIRRICYAIRPKSGGLTGMAGRRLCLWDLEPQADLSGSGEPGQIVRIEDNRDPIVVCGMGTAARLTHFLDRRRIVPAARIGRRLHWQPGHIFDAADVENSLPTGAGAAR